jgi:hypothetical protein
MPTVYLFKFPEYIPLVRWDDRAPNINWPMIQYDTKIFKGVPNNIEFAIKNNDRKTVKLVDYQLEAQIQAVNSPSDSKGFFPELILTKQCIIIDELFGKARLQLLPEEIDTWSPGYYRYVIRLTDGANNSEYLYTDVNKSAFGIFELKEGVVSSLAPAITIDSTHFTATPISSFNETCFVSSGIQGDSQTGRTNGTHTIAVYHNNFQGKFWVQGSLNNEPPLESEWFDIKLSADNDYLTILKDTTSPTLISFTMNLYWLRFIYKEDAANTGKFLQVLYKG